MLVKVRAENNKWRLFDNAKDVEYDENPRTFSSQEELEKFPNNGFPGHIISIVPNRDKQRTYPLKASVIQFIREGEPYIIVFSTICYLCSDTGKTVEKVDPN